MTRAFALSDAMRFAAYEAISERCRCQLARRHSPTTPLTALLFAALQRSPLDSHLAAAIRRRRRRCRAAARGASISSQHCAVADDAELPRRDVKRGDARRRAAALRFADDNKRYSIFHTAAAGSRYSRPGEFFVARTIAIIAGIISFLEAHSFSSR
jgi:hypothetical protein